MREPAELAEGKVGTAEEVAKLVPFLLTGDSAHMTGAELAIEGEASP